MTDEINEEMEPEEIGQDISPELHEPAPSRGGSGPWVALTVVFVVLCALLAALYNQQLGDIQALRAKADQATSEAASLQGASSQVAGDLIELGHQAALQAELQESLGNRKRAEAEIERSRKFLDLAAQLRSSAAASQKQAVVDKLQEVEDKLYPPAEEPEMEAEAPPAESEQPEAEPPTETPEPEAAEAETSAEE